ncbi:hypothetical protein NPIL_396681 [Nephila pilipes]|uniref:Uncharacterized protein n=1 Tax=Nephila pilipes TaxID=299642 RepID=A0A8X6N0L3_NEPPI|nr:hypothetical protein NPIL_396681 [Nephila pilipes]
MKTGPEGSESGNPGSVQPGARSNKREFVRGKVSMIVRNGRHQEGSLIKEQSLSGCVPGSEERDLVQNQIRFTEL